MVAKATPVVSWDKVGVVAGDCLHRCMEFYPLHTDCDGGYTDAHVCQKHSTDMLKVCISCQSHCNKVDFRKDYS